MAQLICKLLTSTITPNILGFQDVITLSLQVVLLSTIPFGNVLAVSCERLLQFSNSKCNVSGLAELQDLRKEMQQTWGRSQKCQRGCISVWICRGDASTHTHAGMCMLRWSWVMTRANISSNFCLLCQQQLLSGIGDGTVPVFPHQWTCICHIFI